MAKVRTIEILRHQSGDLNVGIVVEGEDCFAGDQVTVEASKAKFLVGMGRARFCDGIEDGDDDATPPSRIVKRAGADEGDAPGKKKKS